MITFTADRERLTSAISRAAQGVPPRPVRPVYAGMLIQLISGRAALTTSDSQVTFRTLVDGVASENGSFILPAKVLQEMSRYWTGLEVTMTFDPILPSAARITSGRSAFTLSVVDGKEYPLLDLESPDFLGAMDGNDLATALRKVVPAASESDPILQAVNLTDKEGKLYVVATDRWRMAIMTPQFDLFMNPERERAPENVLIPASVLERFARVIPKEDARVGLGWNDKLARLECAGTEVVTPTVAGEYQKWERIAAMNLPVACHVSVSELTRCVRMAGVAGGDGGAVKLTFDHADLTVEATGQKSGHQASDYMETDFQDDEVSFILDSGWLLAGLAGCGDTADLSFRGTNTVFISSEGFRYMLQARRNLENA